MAPASAERSSTTHDLQKLRDLRNELNAAYRADARSSALRDAVINSVRSLTPFEPRFSEPRSHYNPDKSLVLAIGDFHYGAQWDIKGLRGETINQYSPEVFEARMWALLEDVRRIIEKEGTAHVDVMLCGDTLDGMLRNSQ